MKIFLIEDNKELNTFITDTLIKLDYEVKSCIDGAKAFKAVEDSYDLYIIDINLPNINGLELVKKIKSRNSKAKIFIISGDDNIETILKAYDLGCDDYIKKPFDLREMVAKININFQDKLNKKVQINKNCYYDFSAKMVYYNHRPIFLAPKELSLLEILVKNIGENVPVKDIEMAVWGKTFENGHVRQLVFKLKKSLPCNNIIHNHSSNGYMMATLP